MVTTTTVRACAPEALRLTLATHLEKVRKGSNAEAHLAAVGVRALLDALSISQMQFLYHEKSPVETLVRWLEREGGTDLPWDLPDALRAAAQRVRANNPLLFGSQTLAKD